MFSLSLSCILWVWHRERVKEKEIHKGVSILTTDCRRDRARGRCLSLYLSWHSGQFRVCGLPWFSPSLGFHVNIKCRLLSRKCNLHFVFLLNLPFVLELGVGRAWFLTICTVRSLSKKACNHNILFLVARVTRLFKSQFPRLKSIAWLASH